MATRFAVFVSRCLVTSATMLPGLALPATPVDGVDDAARFRDLQQASDDGTVRPRGLAEALEQRRGMALVRPKAGGISSPGWIALGPGNIGGRIRSILTHPTNPDWLMVGSVSGGLWRSTDRGGSWHVLADLLPNIAIESLARDPLNPLRLYAGTGEGPTAVLGLGMYVSDDGGDTWRRFPGTEGFDAVERIDIHPSNSDIMVVATNGGCCFGGGVWRTLNATSANPTWEKVYDHSAMAVKFDPFTPGRVIVGDAAGGSVGVFDVTTAGASPNFTYARHLLSASGGGRVEIALSRAISGLMLASVDTGGGAVYVSTDHGTTWALNVRPGHLDQGWYANAIWADPVDPRRAIVGGNSLYRLDGPDGWWTTNTPLTVTQISAFTGGSAHPDQHAIVESLGYNATTNRAVYFSNDGGIYRRDDITSSAGGFFNQGWTSLNNGLQVTQFYYGTGRTYADGTTRIAGGTQDNGTLLAPQSGTTWTTIGGGDGGAVALDPLDPETNYHEDIYGALLRRRVGQTFAAICGGANPIAEGSPAICHGSGQTNFITPFVLDPNNRDTMLVGAASLWRSTNVRVGEPPDWFRIKASTGTFISAIAVADGNSDLIWVGHNNGQLYCTINGTAAAPTWTTVSLPASRMITSITIDPANVNRILVTMGGFNASNVWEISDPTQACKPAPAMADRHANLPSAPVYSVARHPANANLLYAGSEVGIFASSNGGTSWGAINDGPSTVSTRQLFWLDPGTLVAATYGRGMFKTVAAPGTLQFSASTASVSESAGSVVLTVTRTGGTAGAVSVAYATSDGSALAGVNYTAVLGTLTWADGDAAGKTVTVPIRDDGQPGGDKTFAVTLSNATGGAVLGSAAATVTVTDSTAQARGTISLSPASLDFGVQSMGTTSAARSITVSNNGTRDVSISGIVASGPFAEANDCGNLSPGAHCTIDITFSPPPAAGPLNSLAPASGTITVTSDSATSPDTANVAGTGEKSLVAHYYRAILRRAPDEAGHGFWRDQAQRISDLGANVNETWFAMAASFFASAEYASFARDDAAFVADLYSTFFNREPDADGLSYWRAQIASGMPRDVVLVGFMFSPEFASFTHGIFGNEAARPEIDTVMDFYRGVLKRLPDSGGFEFWKGRLRTAQCNGSSAVYAQVESISSAFTGSPEYASLQRSNPQFVGDMYNAFLRRGGDLDGVKFWIGQLDQGAMSRDTVRRRFLASPEFDNRVQRIVSAGCVQ